MGEFICNVTSVKIYGEIYREKTLKFVTNLLILYVSSHKKSEIYLKYIRIFSIYF